MGLQPIQSASGADPLVRAGPPGPATSSIDKYQQQADVGVGRGPGGPPHECAARNLAVHRDAGSAFLASPFTAKARF
jgi:hypothetical protein